MINDTITIKVVESDDHSQSAWKRHFDAFCRRLARSGAARSAEVKVVFPGDADPAMATLFAIDVDAVDGPDQPLSTLRAMPGVQFASLARAPAARPRRLGLSPCRAGIPPQYRAVAPTAR